MRCRRRRRCWSSPRRSCSARAQCEGEVHERVDVLAKRCFELKVKADWLSYGALGRIEATQENRSRGSDRRTSVDRRLVTMQKLMLAAG